MKYLLFLFFLLTSTISFGQTQPKATMKSFVKDNKVFWNKNIPIYITLSSNIDSVGLKTPFYLDTEGVNYLRTKWEMDSTGKYVYPLKEQTWKIYADSKPPKTKIKFISESSYIFRGKKYYGDDLKVVLSSTDKYFR